MATNLIPGTNGVDNTSGTAAGDLIYGWNPNGAQATVTSITATRVASGLTEPLYAVSPPGDGSRLFIVEKGGLIKILDLTTGQVLATPFLDVSSQVLATGERGLLGLAFDPTYATTGYFYINMINAAGDTEIRRYNVSASNPNVANPASLTPIITVDQPSASNHKAGWLGFGPDGYLYIPLGDGGSTPASAQNINSLLGKVLRISVTSDDFPGDATRNYGIPGDNMFVGVAGADEIHASGLRNPWRSSFDRALGTFFIADVGQNTWEEVNIGALNANYGWNVREGPDPFAGGSLSAGDPTDPINFYNHSIGSSITGGYVYRGMSEGMHGQYFFADFVASKIFSIRFNGATWDRTDRTGQIVANIGAINNPSSFGEDGFGNLYVVDFGGEIFRLTPVVSSADLGDTLNGLAGDDIIYGGSGNDTLNGDLDNDTLIGGPGNDTFVYGANGGADIVVDFVAGDGVVDRIDLTAFAGIDTLYDVLAMATQNGANTVINFGGGNSLTLQGVRRAELHPDDFVNLIVPEVAKDFNFDGMSDILLRNSDDRVGSWELSWHDQSWGGTIAAVDQSWRIVDTGDLNGDKKADILWRNDVDGRVGIWEMNGNGVQWGGTIGTVDASWHITDGADFSGDGKSDILLRNASDGRVGMWEINSRALSWAATIATVDLSWHIAETGDFNGDGKADILWRNDDGRVGIWEMDGRNPVWGGTIATVGNNWQIADTGDFNGDGKSDILLRDMTDGRVGIWEMNGLGLSWGGTIATVDGSWQIAGTSDFNGDGKSDILLRNDVDNRVGIWEIDGHALTWAGTIATIDSSWQIASHHDLV